MYTSVVAMLACPSNVCTLRRSAPPSSRCVANECRSLWGDDGFAIPAALAYRVISFHAACRVSAPPRGERNTTAVPAAFG